MSKTRNRALAAPGLAAALSGFAVPASASEPLTVSCYAWNDQQYRGSMLCGGSGTSYVYCSTYNARYVQGTGRFATTCQGASCAQDSRIPEPPHGDTASQLSTTDHSGLSRRTQAVESCHGQEVARPSSTSEDALLHSPATFTYSSTSSKTSTSPITTTGATVTSPTATWGDAVTSPTDTTG